MDLYPIAFLAVESGVFMFLILDYFAICRMCVLFDSWLVLPSRLDLLWCSSCVGARGRIARSFFSSLDLGQVTSYKLGSSRCYTGVEEGVHSLLWKSGE